MRELIKKPLFLLSLGAVLTALTLIFPVLGFLEWITMIPLFFGVYFLFRDPGTSGRKAYGYGFVTVYVYYFLLYHWFTALYPLDFAGLDPLAAVGVVAIAWLGLPLLQAIPGGLIFVFYRLIARTGIFKRAPLLTPVAFSALWVVFEWSSTLHWTGVPWGRLALGQINLLPMLQSASLLGSYFVSFLILLVNGLLAYALWKRARAIPALALAAGLLIANVSFGLVSLNQNEEGAQDSLTVAVIQPNIGSQEKWENETALTLRICKEYVERAAAEGAELIVMPETVFPNYLNLSVTLKEEICDLARENGVYMIVGAFYVDEERQEYNSLYLVTPTGELSETVYGKRHLVPFGEYVPMRKFVSIVFPPLADISMLASDLTPGADSALFETSFGKIGSMICFDSIYENLVIESAGDGAELMVISSNDSWFFDTAAVYQHKAQGQLRAIESGRYTVRAANTGISAVIDQRGRVLCEIEPLIPGYEIENVSMLDTATLYMRIGNLFVYLCAAFCVVLYAFGAGKRARQRHLEK